MTIKEVSEKYDISIETLRYYERIGVIPPVNRNENGIRNYTEIDCNWVEYMKLMRSAGLSIESLIEYTALFQQGISTIDARKQILIDQRAVIDRQIKEMEKARERLDKKINGYEDRILIYEENKLKGKEEK